MDGRGLIRFRPFLFGGRVGLRSQDGPLSMAFAELFHEGEPAPGTGRGSRPTVGGPLEKVLANRRRPPEALAKDDLQTVVETGADHRGAGDGEHPSPNDASGDAPAHGG